MAIYNEISENGIELSGITFKSIEVITSNDGIYFNGEVLVNFYDDNVINIIAVGGIKLTGTSVALSNFNVNTAGTMKLLGTARVKYVPIIETPPGATLPSIINNCRGVKNTGVLDIQFKCMKTIDVNGNPVYGCSQWRQVKSAPAKIYHRKHVDSTAYLPAITVCNQKLF